MECIDSFSTFHLAIHEKWTTKTEMGLIIAALISGSPPLRQTPGIGVNPAQMFLDLRVFGVKQEVGFIVLRLLCMGKQHILVGAKQQ